MTNSVARVVSSFTRALKDAKYVTVPMQLPLAAPPCVLDKWWVKTKDKVLRGQTLCEMSGMDGNLYTISASHEGEIDRIHVNQGQRVPKGGKLCDIKATLSVHFRTLWQDRQRK
uniref:Lipoyl-binding domain-containing protein n=1 Tax=Chromera velia CCMP2878 TaxID=1169474 RepID=A0A0G4F798_9ALVE|mmetsp:Transcript_28997/g.56771  ORF Transcript_28997/g.56771 Transcript_28997/m.56771 type:complete len:114 (+) Transcript_28997:148-489(+)|eukprot:Cvel_15604.t1-p1 / transcript=Cvel_15604.t1 / gene=Cvel_15604 / organism=Chromera_velia_CCMP2878 / gene_product=hypothetical protein / transcript_product=hypothetical protein / location=Cvel_scaffold1161:15232-18644(+) / protein_length=113 / sequence_SO=supercontig / SO=protein_coding / is_pseudo=false